mgnify:FL=1|jgi:prepilin-type N-terminal cleavage/methylation domain
MLLTTSMNLPLNQTRTPTADNGQGGAGGTAPCVLNGRGDSAQAGFSLVEVSIVMAIVLLLAIIAIPTVQAYVIEGKVPKVGEEVARFILHTRVNATGAPAAPYDGIATENLANMLRDSSVLSISGTGTSAVVYHGLGRNGEVTVSDTDAGAAFMVTLSDVNHAACPALASVLQRVSDVIQLKPGSAAAIVLKDATTAYSALETESRCSQGDDNTFIFTAS